MRRVLLSFYAILLFICNIFIAFSGYAHTVYANNEKHKSIQGIQPNAFFASPVFYGLHPSKAQPIEINNLHNSYKFVGHDSTYSTNLQIDSISSKGSLITPIITLSLTQVSVVNSFLRAHDNRASLSTLLKNNYLSSDDMPKLSFINTANYLPAKLYVSGSYIVHHDYSYDDTSEGYDSKYNFDSTIELSSEEIPVSISDYLTFKSSNGWNSYLQLLFDNSSFTLNNLYLIYVAEDKQNNIPGHYEIDLLVDDQQSSANIFGFNVSVSTEYGLLSSKINFASFSFTMFDHLNSDKEHIEYTDFDLANITKIIIDTENITWQYFSDSQLIDTPFYYRFKPKESIYFSFFEKDDKGQIITHIDFYTFSGKKLNYADAQYWLNCAWKTNDPDVQLNSTLTLQPSDQSLKDNIKFEFKIDDADPKNIEILGIRIDTSNLDDSFNQEISINWYFESAMKYFNKISSQSTNYDSKEAITISFEQTSMLTDYTIDLSTGSRTYSSREQLWKSYDIIAPDIIYGKYSVNYFRLLVNFQCDINKLTEYIDKNPNLLSKTQYFNILFDLKDAGVITSDVYFDLFFDYNWELEYNVSPYRYNNDNFTKSGNVNIHDHHSFNKKIDEEDFNKFSMNYKLSDFTWSWQDSPDLGYLFGLKQWRLNFLTPAIGDIYVLDTDVNQSLYSLLRFDFKKIGKFYDFSYSFPIITYPLMLFYFETFGVEAKGSLSNLGINVMLASKETKAYQFL